MKSSLVNKPDSSGSSEDDEASTASTAINTSNQQHRDKYLISRMEHHRDMGGNGRVSHGHYDLVVDDDRNDARDELYDNLNSSLAHSDENVNDLDFQMSANSRPFGLLNAQDNRFLGNYCVSFFFVSRADFGSQLNKSYLLGFYRVVPILETYNI